MKRIVPFLVILCFYYCQWIDINLAIGLTQIVLLIKLLLSSSKELSFMLLLSNLAVLQWLVGPAVYYSDFNPGQVIEITIMQVSSETYFNYAWPATIFFVIGLNYSNISSQINLGKMYENLNPTTFKYFIVVGIVSGLILPLLPLAFKFIFVVLMYFSFAGIFGLIVGKNKSRSDFAWLMGSMVFIIFNSFKHAMFGELVFFLILTTLVYFHFNQTKLGTKIILFTSLVLLAAFIQLVKMPLRSLNRKNDTSTYTNFSKVVSSDALSIKNFESDGFMAYTIARFNNGAVVSYVLDRVPDKIDYVNGNTILSAIIGSFVPRLLWPNKETSGSEMYLKYTGLKFGGASYGISQLGEGYANFGRNGGVVYMFLLGLVMSFILNSILKYSIKHPRYLLFLPVLFLHGIKVETELNRSLGFMLRVIVVLFLINLLLKFFSNSKYSLY